jgi:hypothetical protein
MFKWYSAIIILLATFNALHAIKDPDPPKDPSSSFSINKSGIKAYPVEIICAGISKITGNILLNITSISFSYLGKKMQVKIEEIKSIEFLEWQEHPDKKNTFIFYPSKVQLILMNGQQYIINGLPEFNKNEFSENEKKKNLYAYFYDTWEKGRWRNSNTNDEAYPRKNPLPGTLQKIIFIENSDSLDKFIKYLTK